MLRPSPDRGDGRFGLTQGSLRLHRPARREILALLRNLPGAVVATDAEVLHAIDRHELMAIGIGYVDAHLLAATLLTPGARLWTRDTRLAAAAGRLAIAASPDATPPS